MTVVDGNTGKIVSTQPIGRGVDAAEFDPDTGQVFFSTGGGSGALSVFHEDSPDKYTLVEEVKTQAGARTMALDRKTGRVYLSVAQFGPRPRGNTSQSTGQAADDSWHVFSFGVREIGVVCRNRRVPPRAGPRDESLIASGIHFISRASFCLAKKSAQTRPTDAQSKLTVRADGSLILPFRFA